MKTVNYGDQAYEVLRNDLCKEDLCDSVENEEEKPIAGPVKEKWRNHAGFWILGLTNNFAYVVMLSAAFDILARQLGQKKDDMTKGYHCNPHSTGIILLADILPTLLIKWTAPFFMQSISYNFRVASVVLFALGSFLLVALFKNVFLSILGVVFASISCGFGEITFLSLTAHFHSNTVSSWSAGTGAAGVSAAFAYAGMTTVGVSPEKTLLVMLVVPLLMAFGYWGLLKPENNFDHTSSTSSKSFIKKRTSDATASLTFKEKLQLVKPLVKYMIPLFFVYFAEYIINQGLFELLYYPNSTMNHAGQYRWLQFCYQFGVLISRSSVNIIKIEKIEILAALQVCGTFTVAQRSLH